MRTFCCMCRRGLLGLVSLGKPIIKRAAQASLCPAISHASARLSLRSHLWGAGGQRRMVCLARWGRCSLRESNVGVCSAMHGGASSVCGRRGLGPVAMLG
uniref:Uncharacterized protein n=1 Tax=Dromaius novaehollandiae TaxID=8790 RepID=A0A8C4KS40_DRONO